MIELKANNSALEKAARLLEGVPNGIRQAMVSSFNRALLEGRTAGTREATKRYTVKAGIVRRTMVMHRANKNNLEADLASRGRNLAMRYFTHKPTSDTTGARRRQVNVAVRKGSLKPIGQGFIYHGMVMQRVGEDRYPIQQLYSLAVPNILNNDEIVDAVTDKMAVAVDKRLEHETYRILNGFEGVSKW